MRENEMMGIIFSNMLDENLELITSTRCFGAVPFGAAFRMVDFTLSNMVNSRIEQIGVIARHNYRSLVNHIGSGIFWDLNRKNGGVRIISPYTMAEYGKYNDRLEALYGAKDYISSQSAKYVVLSDCNTVSNLNLADILKEHINRDADITLLYKKRNLNREELKNCKVLELKSNERVCDIVKSPIKSGEYNLDLNIWIMERALLLRLISDGQVRGYKSLSLEVLRNNLSSLDTFGYNVSGFAYKILSFEDYFKANMALLTDERRELFNGRAIFTRNFDNAPTIYKDRAEVKNSLIADGCVINGSVKNSIIFRNVIIEEGAEIESSIIMPDCVIGREAYLKYTVCDMEVTVRRGQRIASESSYPLYIKKGKII